LSEDGNDYQRSIRKSQELERENSRLSKKVELLQMKKLEGSCNGKVTEKENQELKLENSILEANIKSMHSEFEEKISNYVCENDRLSEIVKSFNESQFSIESIIKDHERKNRDMENKNQMLCNDAQLQTTKLSVIDSELRQFKQKYNRLTEEASEKITHLENANRVLSDANSKFRETVFRLETIDNKYAESERQCQVYSAENERFCKLVSSLEQSASCVPGLQHDKTKLSWEINGLQRTVDSLKNSAAKLEDLEKENDRLSVLVRDIKQSLTVTESDKLSRDYDLSVSLDEKDQLRRQLEVTSSRAESLQKNLNEVDARNTELQRTCDSLRGVEKQLQCAEKYNSSLELENQSLVDEKSNEEKKLFSLQRSVAEKQAEVEELEGRYSELEIINKTLKRSVERGQRIEESRSAVAERELDELLKVQSTAVRSSNTHHPANPKLSNGMNDHVHYEETLLQLKDDLVRVERHVSKVWYIC